MKYYCKRCESELKTNEQGYSGYCPICFDNKDRHINEMKIIQDYEIPEQYEKRTGKPYPKLATVWERHKFRNGCGMDYKWRIKPYSWVKDLTKDEFYRDVQIVCADLTVTEVPPPYDWKPIEFYI